MAIVAVVACLAAVPACTSSDGASDDSTSEVDGGGETVVDAGDAPDFVLAVVEAVEAVDDELGGPQRYFEVTSNAQFTNVFVAVADATAVDAYVFIDGELQPPAPRQGGASGNTFSAADVDFDPSLVLSGATQDLPESDIDAISVIGNGVGATYVLAATSPEGGFLDIVVGPEGQVFSVDPV